MKWFLSFMIGCASLCFSLEAELFPSFHLYHPNGDIYTFPRGRRELVLFGFQYEAASHVKAWYRVFREEPEFLMHVDVLGVPVLPSFAKTEAIRNVVSSMVQRHLPTNLLDHVGFLFADTQDVLEQLGVPQDESATAHLFLIGEKGEVLWRDQGAPTPQMLQQLEAAVRADRLLDF